MLASVIEISEKKSKAPTVDHCQKLLKVGKYPVVDVSGRNEILNLISSYGIPNQFHHSMKDLMAYRALPVYLDLLVPKALPAQVAKEEERELQVLLDPRENEAAEDCQDSPDQQARLVNQHNVKKV